MKLEITRVASRNGETKQTATYNDGTKGHWNNDEQEVRYIRADGTEEGPFQFRNDPTEHGAIAARKSENGFNSHPEIEIAEMTAEEYDEWKAVMITIEI